MTEIIELNKIIKPLRYFCNAMESNHSLSCVGKYLQEIVSYFKQQNFEHINDIFIDIYTNLIARIMTNNYNLILSAYFLSPDGRFYFRNRYPYTVNDIIPKEKHYKYQKLFEKDEYYTEYPIFNNSTYKSFLENSINDSDTECIDLMNLEPDNIQEGECSQVYISYKNCYNELKEKSFEEILNIDLFKDMKPITETVLTEIANTLGINSDKIHELLNFWAHSATYELPFEIDIKEEDPIKLWKTNTQFADWEFFSQLALRIVSIGTSESDCEWYMSKQRYVAGDFGTNFNIDTMKHRLQVLSDFTEMNE